MTGARSRSRWIWALGAAVGLVAAACSHLDTLSYPDPPPTAVTTTLTTVGNLAGVQIAPVAGTAPAPLAVGPGAASLSGTLSGPNGPVAGADVHAERLVGDRVAAADAISRADGTWSIPNILGGRYRVRAWRVPDMALTEPQIFFLPEGGDRSIGLQLDQFDTATVTTATDPNPPIAGQPAGLAVDFTVQVVDVKGVVRLRPLPGASVELAGGLAWTVLTANPAITTATGKATWQVECGAPGVQPLAVVVNDSDVYSLNLPACATPPPQLATTTIGLPPPASTP